MRGCGDLVLLSNLIPKVLSLALGKSLETRLVSEVDRTLLKVNTPNFIFLLLLLKGLQMETNPESKIKSHHALLPLRILALAKGLSVIGCHIHAIKKEDSYKYE